MFYHTKFVTENIQIILLYIIMASGIVPILAVPELSWLGDASP